MSIKLAREGGYNQVTVESDALTAELLSDSSVICAGG